MNYCLAMGIVKQQRTAFRTSNPDVRIAVRFGEPVLLNNDPTATPAYITWTPTEEDMKAEDWTVHEPDGTPVPPPRISAAGVGVSDRPSPPQGEARGGTATGSGWRRA